MSTIGTADATDPRSAPNHDAHVRPSGWAPGTGSLLGAWLASAAIARLTGATAVVLILATAVVASVFEIVTGWWAARSVHVRSAVAPDVATVGDDVIVLVTIDGPRSRRAIERRQVTLTQPDGGIVGITDTHRPIVRAGIATSDTDSVTVRFDSPGIVTEVTVTVQVAGPAGLIWWRRVQNATIEPLHVAPIGHGPLLEVERSTSDREGSVAARRGNHGGEIDGVRPWRRGDATNSVHWASSLRTDELIVHDRVTSIDERWLVDLDAVDPDRLRWTLGEARRLGHDVEVRAGDGSHHLVKDADDAARWSAIAAQRQIDRELLAGVGEMPRPGFLHRPIQLRPTVAEPATAITGPTRWSAAVAAFTSLAMLAGALDPSPTAMLLLLAVSVTAGAVISMWVARREGLRPLVLQVAIVMAIVAALAVIAVQATEVDGFLAALRGPLPDVLMLLVVLHGFEAVDRRTLRVHLAITFVLASYAGRAPPRRHDGLVARRMGRRVRRLAAHDAASTATRRRERHRGNSAGSGASVGPRRCDVDRPTNRVDHRDRHRNVRTAQRDPDSRRTGAARPAGAVDRCTDRLVTWRTGAAGRLADDRSRRHHRPRSGHGRRGRRLSGLHRGARHQRARHTERRDRDACACARAGVLAGPDLQRVRRPDVEGLAGTRRAAQRAR